MTDIPSEFNPETAPPSLSIDWDAYLPFFEDEDISEADKQELIEALWSIVVSFVDLGFGVHPVQQACGKHISLAEMPIGDVLNSKSTPQIPTEQANAAGYAPQADEGSPAWK